MSITAGNSNELRIIAARRSNRLHVKEIWEYRELLLGLVPPASGRVERVQ